MASHRVHHHRMLAEIEAEIERRRAADNEADREYTTPERLAALRGEPVLNPPAVEDAGVQELWARAAHPDGMVRAREWEPRPEPDFDAEVEDRIREEIDDFEREGGCAPRGTGLRGEVQDDPRAMRGAPGLEGGEEPGSAGERVRPRRTEAHGATRSRATRKLGAQAVRRVDYHAAAPDAFAAMSRLEAYVRRCGLERSLLEIVALRASQLNGCGYCVDMHWRGARRAGQTEQRLHALEAWRATQLFSPRERSALAWTEAVTRLGPDQVSDRTFRMARAQFSDAELVNLTMAVIAINGWNRLAIAFGTERGSHHPRGAARG